MTVKNFIKFLLESVDNDESREITHAQLVFKKPLKKKDGSIRTGISIRPNLGKQYYTYGED